MSQLIHDDRMQIARCRAHAPAPMDHHIKRSDSVQAGAGKVGICRIALFDTGINESAVDGLKVTGRGDFKRPVLSMVIIAFGQVALAFGKIGQQFLVSPIG